MKKQPEYVIRKVESGKVKILGNIFRPSELLGKYGGEFEGKQLIFSLYYRCGKLLPTCSLWGMWQDGYKDVSPEYSARFLWWNEI